MASAGRTGPIAALKRVAETLLTMGQTRLQLLGNEIQIEKHRALQQLLRTLLAVVFASLALVVGIGLLLVLMWDQRVAVLAVLFLVFVAFAAWLAWSVKQGADTEDHPFAASLAELQADLRQLKAASSDGPPQEPR
ncbi:phage holin family protein [Pseudorhodoferax sp. Leaf267]|uniref:phage holin family protein n=1 Tax=Pseudorhodoferax sp. Leaf267 TaxID=1736316 RepID=UPI0006F7EF98|nr:phage holin family protein [Pseudorhodoferax sp. Leaf267]KQP12181.1 hypothetical protein ASF43_21945 [Pseudorhodoferax sp. Leaf267]